MEGAGLLNFFPVVYLIVLIKAVSYSHNIENSELFNIINSILSIRA